MANCPEDLPWWRVVAKSGALPLWKRDAAMADQQRQLLEGEGVPFKGDGVDMAGAAWEPF
jgi:alkylated DNA nucleotide flippase Atl1